MELDTKEIIISLDIKTNKEYKEVIKALKRGIFVALDKSPKLHCTTYKR